MSKIKKSNKIVILISAFAVLLVAFTVILLLRGRVKSNDQTDGEGEGERNDGETLDDTLGFQSDELYKGYFEDDAMDITVLCVSGTPDCYSIDGSTVTFGAISEDSVYSVSGRFKGNIVIDTGDGFKFELELHGLSLVSDTESPVVIKSGDKVTLTAKKDTVSYIYDTRSAVSDTDTEAFSGAVYSRTDLKLEGKGELTVVSECNNGIHSKKDLKVKNLTLKVACRDNALKGNDSVTLESCVTELTATQGDGIKTTNTDVSSSGKQRGTVTISGGTHVIGAARDGVDAAYDLTVEGEDTSITVYTDKYSSASEEITEASEGSYYLRASSKLYKYSVKYFNSETDFKWVNVSDSYETVSAGNGRPGMNSYYYYYIFEKLSDYKKLTVYMYTSDQKQSQDTDYFARSSEKSLNDKYDTVAVAYSGGSLSVSWTNYTTVSRPGGFGGGQDGNTDKKDYSSKGLKAGNSVTVNSGIIKIKSYDDSVHAGSEVTFENGETPSGSVTVNGGTLTLYSNDDGIHADGTLTVTGGKITVENSYEGLEGTRVVLSGGDISVTALDDGVNGTATSGTAVEISGGSLYIYCTGDGIDSNSRTSYSGIVFSGGSSVIIANSNGNSAIDTENGYTYSGGTVLAVMPRGGMTGEATNCKSFSSVGKTVSLSLKAGQTLTANISGETVSVKMPCALSAYVIVLGDSSASVSVD